MLNYSLPITNTKETSGKSILGAYANVAFDNFDKTLQYIYKKVGLKVNGTNQVAVLEKILDAYKKEKEWYRNMFKNFALTAGYLTNALKASAIICQTNAGNKAKQYEFVTGEYHYTKDKKEYSNYYYRIKGKRNTIKASDKIEPDQYDAISDYGLIYLTSLFLSKSDTELMLDQLEVFKNSPFKDEFTMEKAVLTSIMAVYRINIPKGKRMKMEDDNVQLCLDMLNELQKCPQELYDVISQKGKDSFKREQTEPVTEHEYANKNE